MISLNGLNAISLRLLVPWRGAWIADVDVDLSEVPVTPVGPATILIGTTVLVGTVDANASGANGPQARVRVVGGGGGWQKTVAPQQFHNDAGVLSSVVFAATAALVGEPPPVVLVPQRLGADFVRSAGPACRVLDGLDWFVDFTGITQVAPRIPQPMTLDTQILSWDPLQQRAEFSSDSILVPGTILVSPYFGEVTVRDVEQTFDDNGARGSLWCGDDASSRLLSAFADLAREATGVAYAFSYEYRVVEQTPDGRLALQIVTPTVGVPSLATISAWYGIPGANAKITPGTLCDVEFTNGDPSKPKVVRFDATPPLELALGLGIDFVALATPTQANFTALGVAATAASVAAVPGDGGKAAFLAFATAMAELVPVTAEMVKAS